MWSRNGQVFERLREKECKKYAKTEMSALQLGLQRLLVLRPDRTLWGMALAGSNSPSELQVDQR